MPPLMSRFVPVINDASLDARNATRLATSSDWPSRFSGLCCGGAIHCDTGKMITVFDGNCLMPLLHLIRLTFPIVLDYGDRFGIHGTQINARHLGRNFGNLERCDGFAPQHACIQQSGL